MGREKGEEERDGGGGGGGGDSLIKLVGMLDGPFRVENKTLAYLLGF